MPHPLLCFLLLLAVVLPMSAIRAQDGAQEGPLFPARLLSRLDQQTASVNDRLAKQTTRYLARLARREQRLRGQLFRVDSTAAQQLFDTGTATRYRQLITDIQNAPAERLARLKGEYLPGLDSLQGTLHFLQSNPSLLTVKAAGDRLPDATGTINQLQARLGQTEQVTAFLTRRRRQINAVLSRYTHLPAGLTRSYQGYREQVYYYSAQVRACKDLLRDPQRLQQQALTLLHQVPAFASFMQEHSLLAGLFAVPANYGTPQALAGLQTRAQVQQLMASRLAAGGAGAVQEPLQAAQAQLSQLKNKLGQLGGGAAGEMPDFRPDEQKTTAFLQRLEYGANLQTTKSNTFYPTTSDIAASVGYKLNDKSVIGIGMSYKLGLGKDIRHIAFTHQGAGLRSYLDYRLKGSFWLTGGMELNYRSTFSRFKALMDYSAWQQSALIGLSKKYQVSNRVKGNAQVLYDALWKQQVPRTQAVVFRIGYTL